MSKKQLTSAAQAYVVKSIHSIVEFTGVLKDKAINPDLRRVLRTAVDSLNKYDVSAHRSVRPAVTSRRAISEIDSAFIELVWNKTRALSGRHVPSPDEILYGLTISLGVWDSVILSHILNLNQNISPHSIGFSASKVDGGPPSLSALYRTLMVVAGTSEEAGNTLFSKLIQDLIPEKIHEKYADSPIRKTPLYSENRATRSADHLVLDLLLFYIGYIDAVKICHLAGWTQNYYTSLLKQHVGAQADGLADDALSVIRSSFLV